MIRMRNAEYKTNCDFLFFGSRLNLKLLGDLETVLSGHSAVSRSTIPIVVFAPKLSRQYTVKPALVTTYLQRPNFLFPLKMVSY